VAVVGRLVQKQERDSSREETVHKKIQKQNTQNIKITKQKTCIKRIFKNISQIVRK
jgi:hypothetical protein